jgi:flagellar biosynthetic protein FlhB
VADSGSASAKTEQPTARKLREGRRQGQVARSPDLATWSGILVVSFVLPSSVGGVRDSLTALLSAVPAVCRDPDLEVVTRLVAETGRSVAVTMLPVLLVAAGTAAVAGVAQGGARPYLLRLKPRPGRLNPLAAAKRMVGPTGWWELAKQLIKTAVVGVVLWHLLASSAEVVLGSGRLTLGGVATMVGDGLLSMVRSVAAAGLVVGAADYLVARRRVTKQLMMTRKEVSDEHKQSEGDPHVRAALRRRAQAASRNRMMSDVPTADVVLVNPTHVAVALRYQPGDGAPRVVAKGAGAVAARIRSCATEYRVPMVVDVPLARALYSSCEIGHEIPRDLYTAVARVLAFVMSLRRRGAHAGLHRADEAVLRGEVLRSGSPRPMRPTPGRRAGPRMDELTPKGHP